MPQFDINTYSSQLFWLLISLGIIYLYAKRFIVPFAQKVQDRRDNNVNDSVTEADAIKDSILEIQKNYDLESKSLLSEIKQIKEKSAEDIGEFFKRKQAALDAELNDLKQKSAAEIKSMEDNFWQDKDQACLNLAESVIKRIIGAEINQELLRNCYDRVK